MENETCGRASEPSEKNEKESEAPRISGNRSAEARRSFGVFGKHVAGILDVFCLLRITCRMKLFGEVCGNVKVIIIVFNTITVFMKSAEVAEFAADSDLQDEGACEAQESPVTECTSVRKRSASSFDNLATDFSPERTTGWLLESRRYTCHGENTAHWCRSLRVALILRFASDPNDHSSDFQRSLLSPTREIKHINQVNEHGSVVDSLTGGLRLVPRFGHYDCRFTTASRHNSRRILVASLLKAVYTGCTVFPVQYFFELHVTNMKGKQVARQFRVSVSWCKHVVRLNQPLLVKPRSWPILPHQHRTCASTDVTAGQSEGIHSAVRLDTSFKSKRQKNKQEEAAFLKLNELEVTSFNAGRLRHRTRQYKSGERALVHPQIHDTVGVLYGDGERYRQGRFKSGEEATEEEGAQTARSTGVSPATVYRVISQYKSTHTLKSPKKEKQLRKFTESVDGFNRKAIRRKVHGFYFRNERPTVDKVLAVVNDDPDLPAFRRTTFYHLLKELHFKYVRRHTRNSVWVDATIASSIQAFLSGLSIGNKGPSGKGKCLIITPIGSKLGFVEGGLWVFEFKRTGDYHEGCVLISLRKATANGKNVDFDDGILAKELLNIVNQHKFAYNAYAVDEMARDAGKYVLRIPPYYCELNPIELGLGRIKGFVAEKNRSYKLSDIKVLLEEAIQAVTPDVWNKCVCHVVEKVESEMWKLDSIIDEKEDTFIINLNDDSSSSSD
ncbi:hypothetical protein PR048_005722 [Dryococelus australis]|uniref:Tc1-like transposase DDE domain-containing protein n=1 Tax=Dryococelus australis TaxID=614101 RepID=A0ABQ9IA25_9NEOP|nr:hypothetical protein PR048_005722 [Dryococelus australis]